MVAVNPYMRRKIHKRSNCTESESSKYNHPAHLFGPTLSIFKSRYWLYLLFLFSCILVCCHQRSNLSVLCHLLQALWSSWSSSCLHRIRLTSWAFIPFQQTLPLPCSHIAIATAGILSNIGESEEITDRGYSANFSLTPERDNCIFKYLTLGKYLHTSCRICMLWSTNISASGFREFTCFCQ